MNAYVQPINAEFIVPSECMTKRLKIKKTGGKRKIVISTNWLPLYNFNAGDDMVARPLGKGKGLVVELVTDLFTTDKKPKKVYQRSYPKRKNCPLETLIEISSKKDIDGGFSDDVEELLVKFEFNRLTITEVKTFQSEVLKNAVKAADYSIFAACTSGVDLHLMEKDHRFTIHSCIEYRPQEKRDKRDLTETGALSVLRNLKKGIKNLFNEDVALIEREQLTKAVEKKPAMLFMASPQCDEYTNVKASSLKEEHINDLSSSLDMSVDMLKIIECIKAPVIKFEQVVGWYKSDAYKILSLRLRKFGYKENLLISSGDKYGGLTGRTRGYAVFSMLDVPFEFEPEIGIRTESIWPVIEKHMPDCRDISHSKSIQDGFTTGRLRMITKESTKSPTILKGQSRMAKDTAVIYDNDKFYYPSEDLLKELMGFPELKTDCLSKDIAFEVIGQSIDAALHSSVARSVKRHIDAFLSTINTKVAM